MSHKLDAGLLFSPIGGHVRLQVVSDLLNWLVDGYHVYVEGLQIEHIEWQPELIFPYM
jgi:hypothetical protein